MRNLTTFLILLLNLIFQSTFIDLISLNGITPNITLIIVVSYAFICGDFTGAVVGFTAGLLQDIFFGQVIGLNSLIYMSTALLTYHLSKTLYSDTFFTPVIITGIASLIYNFMYYVIFILFQGYTNIGYFLIRIIIPEIIYSCLISIFIYKLIYNIISYFEKRKTTHRLFY